MFAELDVAVVARGSTTILQAGWLENAAGCAPFDRGGRNVRNPGH
jgi:hypothetical protein